MESRRQINNAPERRYLCGSEVRMVNRETRTIRGYGVVFNRESQVMSTGGKKFVEKIHPDAAATITGPMLSMHNHDDNRLLGNTRSGTMRTGVDSIGAWYEVDLPESPTGEDVAVSVARGDTDGSSFQFLADPSKDTWTQRSDGLLEREIRGFLGVFEMGPVTNAAYLSTTVDLTVAKRSMSAALGEIEEETPPMYTTEIEAVDPTTGKVEKYQGPNVPGQNEDEAREYCQKNGLGYCRVAGKLVGEIEQPTESRKAETDNNKQIIQRRAAQARATLALYQ